ncbi:hypothetical protein Pmani_033602 [Petrolisthes manimaculis]|uniref:Uncharacterized protein n=1 Tax=Petrolisthes manimaculis TaxID=1843537 RepID=A0AAE1NQQ4_9EUCA|nr:hypothetical protein Pmani_033602 [Petrolisthes manimaculis]
MARKKTEAQQLLIELDSDKDWTNACRRPGLLVVDVYSDWAGPCSSMTGHLRRIKLELGDEYLTLATARADVIDALEKFRGKAEPTWLFLGSGKPMSVIHGADGPQLLANIRQLLQLEVAALKGQGDRPVVLLDSLVKPEEVLEPDEDLDDVEGEMQTHEDSEESSVEEEPELQQGVLFILPHIISQDKAETFLSNVVAAGFEIAGHVQEELTREELHDIIFPPDPREEEEEEEKEGEEGEAEEEGEGEGGGGGGGEDGEEKGEGELGEEKADDEEKGEKEDKENGSGEEKENTGKDSETDGEDGNTDKVNIIIPTGEDGNTDKGENGEEGNKIEEESEDDLEHWLEELSHGPLYLLLLKVEEGDVVSGWYQVLGPHDLEKAQQEEPDSLVAQFGEEGHILPAWLPRSRPLQERLVTRFFPPPPDASLPRLLLFPDTDHHQVLERLGVCGVRVLAHTQATLQQDSIQTVPSLANSPHLTSAVGSCVLAVVVAGEGTEDCAAEFSPLHLTQDTTSAQAEVELFFPDLLTPQDQPEEPQTQMQIEQSKEGGAD